MQLSAEIGQRLLVGGLRPQRAADPLARDWTAARMEGEKGDELLLSPAERVGKRTSISQNAEAPEELDPKGIRTPCRSDVRWHR